MTAPICRSSWRLHRKFLEVRFSPAEEHTPSSVPLQRCFSPFCVYSQGKSLLPIGELRRHLFNSYQKSFDSLFDNSGNWKLCCLGKVHKFFLHRLLDSHRQNCLCRFCYLSPFTSARQAYTIFPMNCVLVSSWFLCGCLHSLLLSLRYVSSISQQGYLYNMGAARLHPQVAILIWEISCCRHRAGRSVHLHPLSRRRAPLLFRTFNNYASKDNIAETSL